MTLRHAYSFAAALLMVLAPAVAGTLAVSGGWLRALPAGLPAGGYFTLVNNTAAKAVLTGAASPGCGMIMLHKSEKIGGMDHMSMVGSLEIAPGATLEFKPGGYHLMCMQPVLKQGTSVPVTLHFANGAEVKAEFAVRDARGK